MKNYQVFYYLKMNKKEYLEHMFVTAKNQKEAIAIVKKEVFAKTGRNAFRPFCSKENVEE